MVSKRLLVALFLVLIPSYAFAFTFTQSKTSLKLRPGDVEEMWFELSSDHEETVILYPGGPSTWFRLPKYVVDLSSDSVRIPFLLNVPDDVDDVTLLLRIVAANSTERKNIDWIIRVERGIVERAEIVGIGIPSEIGVGNSTIVVDIRNTGNANLYNIRVDMRGLFNRTYFKESLAAGEEWKINDTVEIGPDIAPGEYDEEISVDVGGKTTDSRNVVVRVVPTPVISRERYINLVFLGYQRVEVIRNSGNAEFLLNESRKVGFLERLVLSSNGKVRGGMVTWNVSIMPGEEYRKVDGYNILPLLLAMLVAGFAAYHIYRYMVTPSISKKVVRKGDGIRVYIEVKNKSGYEITDVIVEDRIPPIFRFVKPHGKVKVRKKKTKKFTKILWMVPRLLPGEERILSYDMEFVLGVKGSIQIPGASLHGKIGERKVEVSTGNIRAEF